MKRWPDLQLRARIAQRRAMKKSAPDFVKHIVEAIKSGDVQAIAVPIFEERSDVDDPDERDLAGLSAEQIEELATHVKDCSNCKADLARTARSGAFVPEKLLIAAGIEILRN